MGFSLVDRLNTFGFVRDISVDKRRVQVVVSTGNVARDDMIIRQDGWDFTNYDRNPVVLWAHNDKALPIAKAIVAERVVTPNELIDIHEFAQHPAAEEVFAAVRDGFVNATSVRWWPGDYAWEKVNGVEYLVFTKGHQLLESSYVPIPADPGALVLRADGARVDLGAFRKPEPAVEAVKEDRCGPIDLFASALEAANRQLKGVSA